MSNVKSFNLIVIGGGTSGVSSVYHLLKNKFQGSIGLIEARDRLGGRIHTSKTVFDETKIEIGANWIHGIIGNPIYGILYSKNVLNPVTQSIDFLSHNMEARSVNGESLNTVWVRKVFQAYKHLEDQATLFVKSDNVEDVAKYDDCYGKFIKEKIDLWIEKEVHDQSLLPAIRGLFDSLLKRETAISGANSMNEVSLKYFGVYQEYPGGHLTIPSGYFSLIKVLLEDIQLLSTEHKCSFEYFTNSKVENILWSGLETQCNKKFPITVQCSNGESYQCQHLIVTIPLGCLKKNSDDLFKPMLPEYKQKCIQRMGFGVVDKIFLEYSSKSTLTKHLYRDGSFIDEMMLLWNVDDRNWYTKIYSIYRVTDHCILLWVTGNEALQMEKLSEDQINTDLTEQFRSFFRDPNFPRACNVIVTRWGSDEYSQGSYSYIRTGSSKQDIKQLEMPIYRNQNDSKVI